jgi:hypothetical protein
VIGLTRAEAPLERRPRRFYTLAAEETEKVDTAILVTKDMNLVRFPDPMLELLPILIFCAAVESKLALIAGICTVTYDEASSRRAELMERLIVVLVAVAVVPSLARH